MIQGDVGAGKEDDNYTNLLGLAEACDVPVRWCRTGPCHTCETSLVSGNVAYSPDPVEPRADGSAFARQMSLAP